MVNYILEENKAQGADVSRWQDIDTTPQQIDFKKMKANGANFVYIRATLGPNIDPDFIYNWKTAKEAGLLRGAYHAHQFNSNLLNQIYNFVNIMTPDWGELPMALDVERLLFVGVALPTLRLKLKEVLEELEKNTKQHPFPYMQLPMLYTNPDILQNVLGYYTPWITKYPLWIAHYGVTVPRPGPLYNTYRFWQYTDRGPGLDYGTESKQIDLDYFNGTLNDLLIFSQRDITLTQEERLDRIEQFLHEQLGYIIPK